MISDPAAAPSSKQDPEKPTILVVDDSRLMRHAIKKILAADFTLQEGVDGEDGWEKLLADPGIQVVFTDLSMPGLDGFGLLQRIRSSEEARIREVPVIVITGNEDDETIKERALQSGATDFITKPFQSVQIRARAEAHAKNQRKLQEVTSALEEQATVDAVTQLANPRHFMQHGNENLSFAVRHKSELAMIMLELDNFAALSATMDQSTRDQILVGVADVLRAQTRREDTLARLDAARFGVLLPASNSVGTRHLGKRMLAEIEQLKFFHDGRRVKVSASMGVATPDIKTETTLESIMQCAEKRLTVALQGGGNCLVKDDQTTVASLQETMRQAQEEVLARERVEEEVRQRVEAEAKDKAAEAARIKAEAEARQRAEAEAQAQAKAAEAARLRAEEDACIKAEAEVRQRAEAEAQAKAAEETRQRAEEAARIKAELEAQQRAELEAIALAAEEVRVRAQAQEVERVQRNAEEAERMRANVEIGELRIVAEARSDIDVPDDKHSLEQFEIAAARQRAEQETAQLRIEAESRRRALEDEEKARADEVLRRRTDMVAELARVESKLNSVETDIQSVSGEQIPTDAEPMALRGPIAAIVRGVMPFLNVVNRLFKNKWDNKLDALRKRL